MPLFLLLTEQGVFLGTVCRASLLEKESMVEDGKRDKENQELRYPRETVGSVERAPLFKRYMLLGKKVLRLNQRLPREIIVLWKIALI